MRKADISNALNAAGVEHDPASTVAALTALAAEKGVSLSAVPDVAEEPSAPTTTTESPIDIAARAEIAGLAPARAPKGISEEAIRNKITESLNGLSRAQAIQVLQAQRDEDARVAKEAKAKG